jgi:16S rRNA (cytidine1402-2'-O)-methyltransferase
MLYIVSTPIGNLADITLRALDVLNTVDAILCEDTRTSQVLLNAHHIHTPLISYHSFNEKKRVNEVLEKLKNGQNLALISDAGTPCFQDPGFILIEACLKEGISYTTVPGASSILSALILSGFSVDKFQFIGFLSKKTSEIKKALESINTYEGLSVFFESPKRLVETLEIFNQINPEIPICVIREMTKKFETVHKGTPKSLIEEFTLTPPRGELVCVAKGSNLKEIIDYTDLALELIDQGLSKKSAHYFASKLGFVDKDRLYKAP